MPHVILVAPYVPGQRKFVRGLLRVGAKVTGVGDRRPELLDTELRHLLSGYEHVPDLRDEDAVVAAVQRVQARGPWVDRLESTLEDHVLVAAGARTRTSIPGPTVEQVERCHDQLRMKAFLVEEGLPVVRCDELRAPADLVRFAEEVGYPIVVKPRQGSRASDTWRVDREEGLERVVQATGLGTPSTGPAAWVAEPFVEGHEGFYDTLTVDGEVVFEFASHCYPPVLEAMHSRAVNPQIVHTNRFLQDGYDIVRGLGRQVIGALGLETTATHMEWFHGPRGHVVSRIAARPPRYDLWDVYREANEIDLYEEWARALCFGRVEDPPTRRFAAGLVNLRPSQDGVIRGYSGVEQVQRAYGELIFRMNLPPAGTATQPIAAGYLANAWVCVKHRDYDQLRAILDDIGQTVKVHAS